jgi:elongation factor Ts
MNNIIEKIKKVRIATGLGFLDCKKALNINNEDVEKSIIFLRENNNIKLNIEKDTLEGLVYAIIDETKKNCVVIEIKCETDFVSKSSNFQKEIHEFCNYLLYDNKYIEKNFSLSDEFLSDDLLNFKYNLIKKFRENILIKRIKRLNIVSGYFFKYIHGVNFGKILSIVVLDNNIESLGLDVCMQIVASKPKFLDFNSVDKEFIANERKIYQNKFVNLFKNKNENIIDKMVDGQMKKTFSEIILLEQNFIKNPKIIIKDLLSNVKILSFIRFELGEII